MSKKIFNIENLTFNNCCPECPEQELACRAAITGVSLNEDTDWLIKTTGSQGSEVRVGVYSETLGTYSYSDWEPNLVNTFTILSATMADYMANGDLQFVVEVRNLQGELCDQVFVPFFFYLGELKYLETQSIPLGALTDLTCTGTMTHELVYANGALVHPEDLSINEDLDGYLEFADFPFEDETGTVLITYYCDGVFVGLLAISMTLRMFDVRVLAESAICADGVLTVLYNITNIGADTIPAGLSFDFEFTLVPPLPLAGVEPASGTKVIASNILSGDSIQMGVSYINGGCGTGAVSTFEITAIPATYANFNPASLTDDITFTP